MSEKTDMDREKFLALTPGEITGLLDRHQKPRTGVFVPDGTRHLVMCRTHLSPEADEFYPAYARLFAGALKECLTIFFDHGLKYLFFPLFGSSLLERKGRFQTVTIPAVYREVFQGEAWFSFFQEKGIRVKAYGDLSKLDLIDALHLDMKEGVRQLVEKTAHHNRHTLLFGFLSDNTPGFEMPQQIIDFSQVHHRAPNQEEMLTLYYGEPIPPADFIILSHKLSLRPLPPLISLHTPRIYFFPAPGFLSLTVQNYRRLLYDIIFRDSPLAPIDSPQAEQTSLDNLDKFYFSHKDTIIGIQEKLIGLPEPNISVQDQVPRKDLP